MREGLSMEGILVVDTGTTSMRCALYGKDGRRLFLHRHNYGPPLIKDGIHLERNPEDFTEGMYSLMASAAADSRELGLPIRVISLTSQRSSVIALDAQGVPLRPAIMWQDIRTNDLCRRANFDGQCARVCGMAAGPVHTAPKIAWIQQNEPEVYRKTHVFVGIHEYLIWHLTGCFATDASIASRYGLMDITTLAWSPQMLQRYGVDVEKLCRILPPGSLCGYTTADADAACGIGQGIAVVSAGGDQQVAALGNGLLEAGSGMVNTGTGGYLQVMVDRPVLGQSIGCVAGAIPGTWLAEAAGEVGSERYRELRDRMYRDTAHPDSYRRIDRAAKEPGPWGAPARRALQSIADGMGECANRLGQVCRLPRQLAASGGLMALDMFAQMLANTLGCHLCLYEDKEAGCRGAAVSAAVRLYGAGWREAFDCIDKGELQIIGPTQLDNRGEKP